MPLKLQGEPQMSLIHQPDQAVFRAVLPEEIDWQPFFRVSARGRPGHADWPSLRARTYLIRVKVPAGMKLMPDKHPEDRIYTVMTGVFSMGSRRRVRWRQG
jgi:hypothetical protein